jgi:flagellar biosynthesis/type III secretory pathway M-ring protein FliF/YscJ
MNNLQKALARFVVLLRTMSPQSRMIAAILLVLIVVSGAYLANVGVSGDRVLLLGETSIAPSELISMRLAFAKAGLNDFTVEGNRILVPRAQQSQYLAAIADADALPHNFGDAMRKMLENSNPFIDRKRREDMLKVAVQDHLSRTIRAMGYVEWATVMYDVQQQTFPQNKREVRVCVTVKPLAKSGLTTEQARKIRNVVGPPLFTSPNDVTLVDVHGSDYSAGTDNGASGSGPELYASTQHAYEQQYKEKIQAALSFVPGAVVTVNVELHSEVEDSAQSVKIDAKAPSGDRSERNGNPQAPARLPGLEKLDLGGANSPAAIDMGGAGGYETRHIKRAGLTPKRVTVSVAIPGDYYAQVWRERNVKSMQAEATAEQLAQVEQEIRTKIEQHVARVVPAPEGNGNELASLVTVTAFPPTHKPEQPEISQGDLALAWLNEHSTLMVAVVSCLLGLLILRSIVRTAARNAAVGATAEQNDDELNDRSRQAIPAPAGRRRRLHSAAMRHELRDIVREDPGAAANVLRTWIGSAN